MKNKINFKIISYIFSLFVLSALLFYPALGSYFSQDDFFHLKTIMDKSLLDIPSFFVTWQEGQTFYRPLSREIFNLLMYNTFGLNPLPFHLVNISQIFLIAILSYKLIFKLIGKKNVALLTVFFYLITPIHSVELYYLSSVQQLFATIFLLLSLLLYLSYIREGLLKNFMLSLLFFVLALFSHPLAIVFLAMVLLILLFEMKSLRGMFSKKVILAFAPFLFFGIVYILFSSLFSLPDQKVYQPVYSFKSIINTFGWYVFWAFGLPEMLVDFVGPGFNVNPNLIRWYKGYLEIVIPLLGFFITSLLIFIIKLRKVILKEFNLSFFALSFVLSLSSFLAFPQHKFIFYMPLAAIWFAAAVSYLLNLLLDRGGWSIWGKLWVVGVAVSFLVVSWQTVGLNARTHWAAKRAAAAKFILDDIKRNYPQIEKGKIFYFKNNPNYPLIAEEWGGSSKQAFYILSGADALKLLYRDKEIKVYFEDTGGLPDNTDYSQVIYYTAEFPY